MSDKKHRLIIFSGPSCVGKSPLAKAFAKFYPGLYNTMKPLVLYNSRAARPGETDGADYHFRHRSEIEKFKEREHFAVMDVRGDLQALDINELKKNLETSDVFFEGNPVTGKLLLTRKDLQKFSRLGIFMSPVSKDEIQHLKTVKPAVQLPEFITDVMRRKLLRRTRKQKGELSFKDLENIEKRASSAFGELIDAHHFQYVIPNHDGEDSENWDAFYHPLGDARKALLTFVSLLKGEPAEYAEKWDDKLLEK